MPYRKLQTPLPGIEQALAAVLGAEHIDNPPDMLASGVTVELDAGEKVWIACAASDNPDTLFIEFLTVAISDVQRKCGLPVARTFYHATELSIVAERGSDAIRRDLMLTALGEQDMDGIPTAPRSIRVAIDAMRQVGLGGDVL